jgi:hypothetical protein
VRLRAAVLRSLLRLRSKTLGSCSGCWFSVPYGEFWSANLKFPRTAASFFSIGALFFFLLEPGHNPSDSHRHKHPSAAYIQRGNQVQEHYQTYSQRLAGYHKSLLSALRTSVPDLIELLRAAPPLRHGYQILPEILPVPSAEAPLRARTIAYSWPWTDRLIDQAWQEIVRHEAELRRAKILGGRQSRIIFERLASEFQRIGEQQRNIDAHLQYNRFWQAAIAADRAGYDLETALQNEVLERQGILDGLKNLDAAFGKVSISLKPFQTPLGLVQITNDLRTREASLTHRINGATSRIRTPGFVGLEHRPHEWVFRVPLYTDIEDQAFVVSTKRIIESTWQLQDGINSFRVEIDIKYISTDLLYADSEKPIVGQRIDILEHLRRFPPGAAILTTGALTTHVRDYAIILGPHTIAPRVLAHEFGHLLGFRDRYIRGYKDLGEGGFQVIEVIADPNDIMAVPSTGSVLKSHFELILRSKSASETPIAPEREILPTRERSQA